MSPIAYKRSCIYWTLAGVLRSLIVTPASGGVTGQILMLILIGSLPMTTLGSQGHKPAFFQAFLIISSLPIAFLAWQ